MYQDLSFMKIPLPEDVLKLKNYGDYAGAQKMIRYFSGTQGDTECTAQATGNRAGNYRGDGSR